MTRKLSGQTITIIILAILLLFVSVCGGVYAYYSYNSNKISGYITLGNLKISMTGNSDPEGSGSSYIYMTSGLCVPNQSLENSPLTILNYSNVPIYLVVLYSVTAVNVDDPSITIDTTERDHVLDIGNNDWVDYKYSYIIEDNDEESLDPQTNVIRSFVNLTPFESTSQNIEVIGENRLKLHRDVGNEFQSKRINLSFQAFAIASQGLDLDNKTDDEKCKIIMDAIYDSVRGDFGV